MHVCRSKTPNVLIIGTIMNNCHAAAILYIIMIQASTIHQHLLMLDTLYVATC